jgi:diguanylate cyclase (GGDEF)-like protein/PAS domain S-box-containing protein
MPDYNAGATAYWWFMVALGAAVLLHTVKVLTSLSNEDLMRVGAGAGIAMLAGLFPVRIPRSKNSFAAGEIFIFLLLLMYGPAAAVLAAAGEGLIGSWRTSKRWTSRIASPAMASVAMFITGSFLHACIGWAKVAGIYGAAALLMGTMAAAVIYFVLNTMLVTAVPYLKRKVWPTPHEIFSNFGWIGITFAGSACVACLLFLTFQQSGIGVLMVAAPLIAMLLTILHYFFRQQEADETVRNSRVAAIEREAELTAHHVRALEVSERRFHSAFTHASIGMALVSFDGRVLQLNAALRSLLGNPGQALVEHRLFSDLVDDAHVAMLNEQLAELTSQKIQSFAVELRLKHSEGSDVWASVDGSFFSEIESSTPCLILQTQDITARRQAEAELHQIAFHDALTGLPNRRRFHEQLTQAVERVSVEKHRSFALMFLDFDRFKLINDSLGHAAGDEFLVQVAHRIRNHVRPTDVVARLGGDEFAIIAEDLNCEAYAVSLAGRLLEVMRQPIRISNTDLTTSASIGITLSSMGYASPTEMLRDADIAMYKAKAAGKARYALFDVGLHAEVSNRLRLEGDLRRAMAAGQLSVAYQPLFDLTTQQIMGFEALARWEHPELGAISPAVFIPVAEEAGLMIGLTDLILRSACKQLKRWQLRHPDFRELDMHVNVAGQDIAHAGFIVRVKDAIAHSEIEAQHLTLELTENILMERLEAALPKLTELRNMGVGLSVDDFGTGYSSLRHLSSLPVSSLKIDRAFVADLNHDSNEAAVVRAIVLLGKSLGKAIIAEGIETATQVKQLLEMGCTMGQGFHLSRPMAPELIDQLLDTLVPSVATRSALPSFDQPTVFH